MASEITNREERPLMTMSLPGVSMVSKVAEMFKRDRHKFGYYVCVIVLFGI